jgi:hypothetical protein
MFEHGIIYVCSACGKCYKDESTGDRPAVAYEWCSKECQEDYWKQDFVDHSGDYWDV